MPFDALCWNQIWKRKKNMQRVFIAWSHALFRHSVYLLLDHPRLTVVGDSQSLEETAQAELESLHPDTIIVEVPEAESSECMAALQQLTQFCHWNPRLICVSLQDNTVWTYRRQQYMLEESQDLLHLILNE
jgi:DNA-binding NarL/FixJ family response regulator